MATVRRTVVRLVLALALVARAGAGVSPDTKTYLSSGPRDARQIFARARGALQEGRWDDAAALAEAILRLGKEHPRVLALLARCRLETGQREVARALVERALELDPSERTAKDLLERLERLGPAGTSKSTAPPTTLAERVFGPSSPLGHQAQEAYHQDRLQEALKRADEALAADPADPAALLVKALTHRDMLEEEGSEPPLEFLRGRFPKASFLELLGLGRHSADRQRRFYEQVEKDPGADPLALAKLAGYKHTLHRGAEAKSTLERARRAVTRPDRETLLAIAEAAQRMVEIGIARATLDQYRALFGEDALLLAREAWQFIYEGRPEDAARAAVAAYRREPRRLWVLVNVSEALDIAGKEREGAELWALAAETFPGRRDLERRSLLGEYLSQQKDFLKEYRYKIFHVRLQQDLPEEALGAVLPYFEEAYRVVGSRLDTFPQRVRLVIHWQIVGQPGVLAYFCSWDDTIYVGAIHYRGRTAQEATEARTVTQHEYAHYLEAELQRNKGIPSRVAKEPKWLSEGLAEWASDGLGWREAEGRGVVDFLSAGPMPIAALQDPATIRSGGDRVRAWYLQGNFMVSFLLERGRSTKEGLDRLIDLSLDLIRGDDLGQALERRFGLTLAQFEEGYRERMKRELARLTSERTGPRR